MSSYFNRDDQALHGFAAHFKTESGEERAHGMKLMEYQTKRGGRVVFQDVAKPTTMEWGTPLEAMEAALSWRRRSTRACWTCTRWPGTRATDTSATSLSPSTWASRWRASRPSGIRSPR